MRIHRWHRLAVGVVAAVLAAVGTPAVSHASGATISGGGWHSVEPVGYVDPTNEAKSFFTPVWQTDGGPCTMFPDSQVVLSKPDSAGNGWAAWHGTVFRSARDTKIWYGSFRFLDRYGNYLGGARMQSPRMTQRYTDYTVEYYQPMFITPANFVFVTQVEIFAGC